MSTRSDAKALAYLICTNASDWHYDNCKVPMDCLEVEPLADIIEPSLPLPDHRVLGAWDVAVQRTHAACVDWRGTPMAVKNPLAYCIKIFRGNLAGLRQLQDIRDKISAP